SSRAPVSTPEPEDADVRPSAPDTHAAVAPDLAVPGPDAGTSPDLVAADEPAPADAPPAAAGRSAGCQGGTALPEGQATIDVARPSRTYILRLPNGYTKDRAWPLVLALHPNGGSGIGFWDATSGARSIRALARDKAIVVLPLARPLGNGFDWRGDLPADL